MLSLIKIWIVRHFQGNYLKHGTTRVFETRTATEIERARTVVFPCSQIFILIISNGQNNVNKVWLWLCEEKLKGKAGHFWLPSELIKAR